MPAEQNDGIGTLLSQESFSFQNDPARFFKGFRRASLIDRAAVGLAIHAGARHINDPSARFEPIEDVAEALDVDFAHRPTARTIVPNRIEHRFGLGKVPQRFRFEYVAPNWLRSPMPRVGRHFAESGPPPAGRRPTTIVRRDGPGSRIPGSGSSAMVRSGMTPAEIPLTLSNSGDAIGTVIPHREWYPLPGLLSQQE